MKHEQFAGTDLDLDREDEESSPNKNCYKIRAFDNAIRHVNKLDHPLRSAGEAITVRNSPSAVSQCNSMLYCS
jgi:DNA polymerase beta